VHMVCGIWGTLAVGLFGALAGFKQLGHQFIGVVACGTTAFICAFIIFIILKYTIGIRVTEEHEINGLDVKEHGIEAYPNFSLK